MRVEPWSTVTSNGLSDGPGPYQEANRAATTSIAPSPMSRSKPRNLLIPPGRRGRATKSIYRPHHQAGIGAAKAEAVVEYGPDLPLLGHMRHKIDALDTLAGVIEIKRRRHNLVA